MTKQQEQNIIKKCQQGDMTDFALLYDLYVEKIYRFVYYKTFNKQTAEDLVSDTFFKAMDKIDTFSGNLGNFSSWLYKIALNNIRDHFRAKHENINIEDVWDLQNKEALSSKIENKYDIEKIQEYLKILSPQQRDIIMMRLWGGLSYKEISQILGESEENCRVIFHRSVSRIRKDVLVAIFVAIFITM